ncbi:MAG: ribosome maturation factor RimP [candidate division WOR-3 bacterium]
MSSIEQKIEEIVMPIIEDEGYVLVDIEYRKSGKFSILRIFIDRKEGGITIKELEEISKKISLALDVEDPIENSYTLEVSSPGLDRELVKDRELKWAISKKVKIFFKNGSTYEGFLNSFNDEEIVVSGKVYKRVDILKIKLNEV